MNQETAIYQHTESGSQLEVRISEHSVWLTQEQMANLFGKNKRTISEHIGNIFKEGELEQGATVRKFRTVQQEGDRKVTRNMTYYNLDVIITVGNRVSSNQNIEFQNWAHQILANNQQITKFDQNNPTLRVIHSKIFQIRGCTVMIDSDLATFYQTETRILKQAVRRNLERFPEDFMFELDSSEVQYLGSQSVIPLHRNIGKSKPFAFTEQGVAMLSAVLNTPIAVDISLQIMRAFVEIRKLALSQYSTENRLANVEQKQIAMEKRQIKTEQHQETANKKINQILEAINQKKSIPNQKVFYDGQIFDAHTLVSDIIGSATHEIILIDNYVDMSVLTLFSEKKPNVRCTIYTKRITERLQLDILRFNAQYGGEQDNNTQSRSHSNGSALTEGNLEIRRFAKAHDRFLIIDRTEVYHIGASLKDLGKKWFAFTKLEDLAEEILHKLEDSDEPAPD